MKIVCLNTWGCRIPKIFEFIKKNSGVVDVFCFQEILSSGVGKTDKEEPKDSLEKIKKLLPEYIGYFSQYGDGGYNSQKLSTLDFKYGAACFVKKDMLQKNLGTKTLYSLDGKWANYHNRLAAGVLQGVQVEKYVIINIHGLWEEESHKKDTDARFEQTSIINNFLIENPGKHIICGDFNLLPNTKLIQILGNKYKDLIKDFGIKNTRSLLYKEGASYADYIFIDSDIIVNNLSVPNLNISDHLPLILEFNK